VLREPQTGGAETAAEVRSSRLALRLSLPISSLAVVGFGLLWLWRPELDGACEIYSPRLASRALWFDPILGLPFALGVTFVVLLLHIGLHAAAWPRRRRALYVAWVLAPFALLTSLYVLYYPAGIDWPQRRVDSFQLGARWAVKRAGGPAKLRQDALSLLVTAPDMAPQLLQPTPSLSPSRWPKSFRALHAMTAKVDRDPACIDIVITPRSCFADTFGYVIASEDAPEPDVRRLHGRQGHRLWKIDDGIYLYEE
jgi:hypothetical protein